MRIVRYQTGDGKKPKYGWLLGDKVGEIGGNVFGRYRRKEADTPLTDVRLVAPSEPSKVLCVGKNYVEHAKELGSDVPKVPLIFMKPPSSIVSNEDT
ncbi:MAG TPA: Rv2993c-like domain-containing protein, partial [Anaerolineales bacterium]